MTDKEMRIAVAEALGWKLVQFDGTGQWEHNGIRTHHYPPFYHKCLNACAEFEATLPDDNSQHGLVAYCNTLAQICGSHRACVTAKPRQRCEAFLRMKGLWRDTKQKGQQ